MGLQYIFNNYTDFLSSTTIYLSQHSYMFLFADNHHHAVR